MPAGRGLKIKVEGLDRLERDLRRLGKTLPEIVIDALHGDAGEIIQGEAKRRINSRTGKTAADIKVRPLRRGVAVGYDGEQHVGTWLESGTQMHIIAPLKEKALRMASGTVVEKSVHPGTKPQRIMSKTLKAVQPEVERVILDHIDRALGHSDG